MAKISIIIDRRRARANGTFPICLRFTNINTAAIYVTSYSVLPSQWRAGRVINHDRAALMNQRLHQLLMRAMDAMETSCGFVNRLPATVIRDRTMRLIEGSDTHLLLPTFDRFIAMKNKRSTIESFRYTRETIARFSPSTETLTLDSVSVEWLHSFERWLLARVKRNTCAIHLENLRAVMNYAVAEGITTCYPFAHFTIKREQSIPRVLSLEEMRALWAMQPQDPYLAWYLDTFRLSFALCGMNIADIFALTRSNIINGRIVINRQKTGVQLNIAIAKEAQAIIERMKGKQHLVNLAERYRDHKHFLSRCNRGLHRLHPNLTTYYARHTWATIAASLGVPIEVIGMGLGHRYGSPVTNIYIQHDLRRLDEANRMVLDAVSNVGISDIPQKKTHPER